MKDTYKCTECNFDELADKQNKNSFVTNNPPVFMKDKASLTIHKWDRDEYTYPVELNYYITKSKCEDCTNGILDLVSSGNTNKFSQFDTKIKLEKAYTLLSHNVTTSVVYTELKLKDPKNFFDFILDMNRNILFSSVKKSYTPEDILFGQNDDDLEVLRSGDYYENFMPNYKTTTGLYINTNDKSDKLLDIYTMNTGYENVKEIRTITNINGYKLYNTNKNIYSNSEYKYKNIPLYDVKNLTELSDGIQYSADKETIYYYDKLSSRNLEFKSKDSDSVNKIACNKYIMTANISQAMYENSIKKDEYGTVFEKFNKPYIISKNENDDNYICVDAFTNFVLGSNITISVLYIY